MDGTCLPTQYQPGCWEQDIYTLPLEAAIAGTIPFITPVFAKPLWPFTNETNDEHRLKSRHPGRLLTAVTLGSTTVTYGLLKFYDTTFPLWIHTRGLIHAHLLTEITTAVAKSTFQRHRPFYDTQEALGEVRKDDHYAFFSGHASHIFTFASYTSYLVNSYAHSFLIPKIYTAFAYTFAATVSAARVWDHQHHTSDVVVGALVGFFWGTTIYFKTENVAQSTKKSTTHTFHCTPGDLVSCSWVLKF